MPGDIRDGDQSQRIKAGLKDKGWLRNRSISPASRRDKVWIAGSAFQLCCSRSGQGRVPSPLHRRREIASISHRSLWKRLPNFRPLRSAAFFLRLEETILLQGSCKPMQAGSLSCRRIRLMRRAGAMTTLLVCAVIASMAGLIVPPLAKIIALGMPRAASLKPLKPAFAPK